MIFTLSKKEYSRIVTVIAIMLSIGVIGVSLWMTGNPFSARAGQVWLGAVTVVSPKPPAVRSYDAGSRMEFQAQYTYNYCGNTLPVSKGAMTQPVLYGNAHTSFGPERNSAFTLGSKTENSKTHRYLFNSTYKQFFIAPTQPGIYWFNYRLGARNRQNTDRFVTGTAVFEVKPFDLCKNIDGVQEVVPNGNYQSSDFAGQSICLDISTQSLICTASKNPILPGESVTFTAKTRTNGIGAFKWFNGSRTTGTVIKSDQNVAQSQVTRTYTTPGIYQVTAQVAIDNGVVNSCIVGVTVQTSGVDINNNNINNNNIIIDEGAEGLLLFIDPNTPPAEIDFTLDRSITNDTCKAKWDVRNVLGCELYRNNELPRLIDSQGSEDLVPGRYQIKCLKIRDGTMLESAIASCVLNPEIREI